MPGNIGRALDRPLSNRQCIIKFITYPKAGFTHANFVGRHKNQAKSKPKPAKICKQFTDFWKSGEVIALRQDFAWVSLESVKKLADKIGVCKSRLNNDYLGQIYGNFIHLLVLALVIIFPTRYRLNFVFSLIK